jgi:DNA-binding NarL/FixJ family response regulator
MIRVLVADDQAVVRAGLVALLTAAPGLTVVGEAGNGHEAVSRVATARPEVVLMDVRMPGLSGLDATRRILATAPDPPPRILVLTTFDLDEYVYEALRAGASGFLLKETEPARLLAAIHTVAAGDMLFAPTVTRRLIEAYLHTDRNAMPAAVPLTTREREVVRLVAAGLSNADIASKLTISEGTVKTHVNRAMTKLDLTSRAQVVVYAYENGLVRPQRS